MRACFIPHPSLIWNVISRNVSGAGGRTRTDMRSEPRQILSLVRIPISPLRLLGHVMIEARNVMVKRDGDAYFFKSSIVLRRRSASGALGRNFK